MVNLREKLDIAISSYGIGSVEALNASQQLDKQILVEQLTYNALKAKGYIETMVNEVKNDRIIRLIKNGGQA